MIASSFQPAQYPGWVVTTRRPSGWVGTTFNPGRVARACE